MIAIDAPKHGLSKGDKANQVSFAEAITKADLAFRPFYGAVGQSMGAAALALALASGVKLQRCVLISSPARILDSLMAFASYIGLPEKCSQLFIKHVEVDVGHPAHSLDIASALQQSNCQALLIHSRDDLEVPFHSLERIKKRNPSAQTYCPSKLGHRGVLRDKRVIEKVSQFFQ